MGPCRFESERLTYRDFGADDFPLLRALDTDPEVMEHVSGGVPQPEVAIQASLARILARQSEWRDFGFWVAERRASGEPVGWFALKPLPGTDEIEVGYRLLRRHWNQGYATEGAARLVAYGLDELGLGRVVGIVNVGNLASRRVLEKAGLVRVDDREYRSGGGAAPRLVSWFEARRP